MFPVRLLSSTTLPLLLPINPIPKSLFDVMVGALAQCRRTHRPVAAEEAVHDPVVVAVNEAVPAARRAA